MENSKLPAFSVPGTTWTSKDMQGLTKREYFAAMAMQGLISSSSVSEQSRDKYTVNDGWAHPETIAKCSIQIADAILKQLES